MQEGGDIAQLEIVALARQPQTGKQSLRGVVRRRLRLVGKCFACRLIQDLEVRERAADVDGNANPTGWCCALHV